MILTLLASVLPGVILPMFKQWLENNNNIETTRRETALKTIDERMEARKLRAATVQTGMGHKPFWVGWLAFVLPLALWWNAVLLDSIFLFSGSIPDLPQSVRPWADAIFENIFLPGGIVGKAIGRR